MGKTANTISNYFLTTPLTKITGRAAGKLEKKLGLTTVGDLLYYFPRKYQLKGQLTPFHELIPGEEQSIVACITDVKTRRTHGGKWMMNVTLSDGSAEMSAVFWARNQHMIDWMRRQLPIGETMLFSGRPNLYRGHAQLTHPSYEQLDENQTAQALIEQPKPIYSAAIGLPTWTIAKAIETVLSVLPEDLTDPLPDQIRAENHWPPLAEAFRQIHTPQNSAERERAAERFRYEEAFVLQTVLAQARAARTAIGAPQLETASSASAHYQAVKSSLPFTLTAAQEEVLSQIDQALAAPTPANLLLQGDVGAGKTVVALLALLRAIDSGFQGALMAPTEVLAEQHFETITELLGSRCENGVFNPLTGQAERIPVWLLTASTAAAQKKQILSQLAAGVPGLVIGTHALLSEPVRLSRAGLLIIDEQHRFGVEQRDRLRTIASSPQGNQPHLLVMTATPIPRSIAMTSFGDLDLLVLPGLPAGRAPVETFRVPSTKPAWRARTWQRAAEEISRGGRVFVVCPLISQNTTGEGAEQTSASNQMGFNLADDLVANRVLADRPLVAASAGDSLTDCGARADSPLVNSARADSPLVNGTRADSPLVNGTRADNPLAPPSQKPLPSVETVANYLSQLPELAGISIAQLHGRQKPAEKAQIMNDFRTGKTPLLVATTVIEVGVNVPEATMMVILEADRFGLAQLHQLRGRIGRGTQPGVCLLWSAAAAGSLADQRLEAFAGTTDGFKLAQMDLELRQAGNLLGSAQSGYHSGLRLLNLVTDEEIINSARQAAQALVAADPNLAAHPGLNWAIEQLLDQEAEQFLQKT